MAESRRPLVPLCLCLLLGASVPAAAQEYSYDGNRWYEVEVSIFTNEYPAQPDAEITAPDLLRLAFLPRVRELQAPAASFAIDFATAPGPGAGSVPPEEPPPFGPRFSPATERPFRISDFSRDAFIDLRPGSAQFNTLNRDLDAAPEHRLLWHHVWRQPMQGRAQTPAVFVLGGDMRGTRGELEGSLRLSDNAGSVMLDINVWLNRFVSGRGRATEWELPELPFPPAEDERDLLALLDNWNLVEVWQLEQTRELGADQFYYIDNPALGALIQIRPYVLPPRQVAEDETDF